MKTKRFDTNKEFVNNLMDFSPAGGLCQVFIIEAIRHYAEQVAATNPPAPENDTGFISARAWHTIAVDITNRMKEQYEKQEES